MRLSDLLPTDFNETRVLDNHEGGAVRLAERDGRFYVVQDERTFAALLDEEDLVGIGPLLKVYEFDSDEERADYLRGRGWLADGLTRNREPFAVQWYGERGIVNAILTHIQRGPDPISALRAVLAAIVWADGSQPAWVPRVDSATVLVEIGLADFGNPDVVIVLRARADVFCVFLEAKVGPYLVAMRSNRVGMREPGFNSSINGQLALKYRFARALETALPSTEVLKEPEGLLRAYVQRLDDPRRFPRGLAKPDIVREMLAPLGMLGLPEAHCHYVALTWDAEDRAFMRDPAVRNQGGLPCLLAEDGTDRFSAMGGRVGWLGYQVLERVLHLQDNAEYGSALRTMVATSEPNSSDYSLAEALVNGRATPETTALAARLARHFAGYKVVEYPGSYSITDGQQTIAKIIPRREAVFLGVRGAVCPDAWALGPSHTITVRGVPFTGLLIPADTSDGGDLQFLLTGLEQHGDRAGMTAPNAGWSTPSCR